ncbi:MAG: DUF6572 domain-containing protein [Burkholderiales bacterium]
MTVAASGMIDFVAHDPGRDEALLVMVEERPWGSSGHLLGELQAKLNVYLDYIVSGQLERAYPQLTAKRVNVQLRAVDPPGPRELEFLAIVARTQFLARDVRLTWQTIGQGTEHEVS